MPLQEWGSIPDNQTIVFDATSVANEEPIPILFVIKDLIDNPDISFDQPYTNFRLVSNVYYGFTDIEWLEHASYANNGYSGEFYEGSVPYSNGMTFDFVPVLQNLLQLPNGTYSFVHNFLIEALTSDNEWVMLALYTPILWLEVLNNDLEGDVSFSPMNMAFTHKQNDNLPSKNITMTGLLWKIIGKPNFVFTSTNPSVVITTVGTGATAYQTVEGDGGATVNVALGAFYDSDAVLLPADLSNVFEVHEDGLFLNNLTWTVAVTRLSDFIISPYAKGSKAFTRDPVFFEFFSSNPSSYFQFDAEIKTYNFFTNEEKIHSIPQKIVLFAGKQKINLGKLIHRLMWNFEAPNDTLLQYKEAILKINCVEKLQSDNSIIRSAISADIPFVAGLSKGMTDLGFLEFNAKPNRVTKESFALLNFITPPGNYEIRTFKNGTQIGTPMSIPASTGIVFCKKILFNDYEKGDTIDFVLDEVGQNNSDASTKSFVVFPEGMYSNHIVWENEFLVQSAIECTGTMSIVPEGEFQSQTVYNDLVEKLEHLSSSKKTKININTGWLMASDIDTIESLMRAQRAWLVQGNDSISLVPTSKKLPEKNLEEELIEYQLEFQINQQYDEETYSL